MSEALYGMCKTVGREEAGQEANERTLGCVMDTQLLYVPAAKNNCIYRAGIAMYPLLSKRITVNVSKAAGTLSCLTIFTTQRIVYESFSRINTN